MSEEIKERVIRVLINSGILILITLALDLSIPGTLALISLIPKEGLSLDTALLLLLIMITAFLALRILLDLMRLVDLTSDYLTSHIPGLKVEKRISIMKALKEMFLVLILVLITTLVSPALLLIPSIGSWLTIGLSAIVLVACIILIYDAGKTLYVIFESGIQLLIDKLAGTRKDEAKPSDVKEI